ncbi:CocE/NonD family hydrolase [Nocardioides luti]|nr:CocE/NonD family hydrolase [Nocardioides luti]
MRDGTVLRADVYRPAGDDECPVLLHRTPYNKSTWDGKSLIDPVELARRGYIVVHQDCRGRDASDGLWLPWAHEELDGYDTVEWAAQLEGSNGRVGMVGASYTGNTQWKAAISRPPGLRAIAPMQTWSDPADGLMFRGGAIELGLNNFWTLGQAFGGVMKTRTGESLTDALETTLTDINDLHRTGYWQLPSGRPAVNSATGQPDIGVARALEDPGTLDESRVLGNHDRVQVPSLSIAGWHDVFQQGTIDNYIKAREAGLTSRLIVGPWDHMTLYGHTLGLTGEVAYGFHSIAPGPQYADLSDCLLTWFEPWLKDGAPTAEHESGVRIFVMGVNEWRDESGWPLEREVPTPLYLSSDASLSFDAPTLDEASSSYTYDPTDPAITVGGPHFIDPHYARGPADQRRVEERSDVLVFTSAPLEHDLELTGRVRASLFAATDGPSTDWVVRLCVVDGEGVSRNIVDGIVRTATTPGLVMEHEIDLWSTSIVVATGERLRVHVTSSNFPRWDRNLNTGEPNAEATTHRVARQVVMHDRLHPSHLTLPVIPR